MRTATGLTLLATGSILTFAVTAHPSFLNLQIVGVVLMVTGVAGLFLPKPSQGWRLRRRTILHGNAGGRDSRRAEETANPPYVMLNPGARAGRRWPRRPGNHPADVSASPASATTESIPSLPADDLISEQAGSDDLAAPGSEVVEEYVEE